MILMLNSFFVIDSKNLPPIHHISDDSEVEGTNELTCIPY